MDETAAITHHARRNLRDAERNLRSVETSLRDNEADLAAVRAWITAATEAFNGATAAGDSLLRDQALQALADAHDSLRDFQRMRAKFAQLKPTALRNAIRARLALSEAARNQMPDSANPPNTLAPGSLPAS